MFFFQTLEQTLKCYDTLIIKQIILYFIRLYYQFGFNLYYIIYAGGILMIVRIIYYSACFKIICCNPYYTILVY